MTSPPAERMLPILSLLACLPSPPGADGGTSLGALEPAGLEQGGLDAVADAGAASEGPAPEGPCSGAFTTNTQVSLARGEIVIDRYQARGGRDRLEVPLVEVRRLVHERWDLETAEGGAASPPRCSTLWLVLEDGRQVLFDDASEDLGPRASRLAELIGVPLGPPEPTVVLPVAEGGSAPAAEEALAEATVGED